MQYPWSHLSRDVRDYCSHPGMSRITAAILGLYPLHTYAISLVPLVPGCPGLLQPSRDVQDYCTILGLYPLHTYAISLVPLVQGCPGLLEPSRDCTHYTPMQYPWSHLSRDVRDYCSRPGIAPTTHQCNIPGPTCPGMSGTTAAIPGCPGLLQLSWDCTHYTPMQYPWSHLSRDVRDYLSHPGTVLTTHLCNIPGPTCPGMSGTTAAVPGLHPLHTNAISLVPLVQGCPGLLQPSRDVQDYCNYPGTVPTTHLCNIPGPTCPGMSGTTAAIPGLYPLHTYPGLYSLHTYAISLVPVVQGCPGLLQPSRDCTHYTPMQYPLVLGCPN